MDKTHKAKQLYEAIDARDPEAILSSLSNGFLGEVSAGMPLAVGGHHEGREAMLRDVWLKVFAVYDVRLEVESFLEAEDDVVVAIGNYRGTERQTTRPFDARFAHVLRVSAEGITSLEQITDTGNWRPVAG